MKTNRTENQIRVLETAFRELHGKFMQGKPVDRELSAYFRRNRQMGAKDRRFISNAIFAYYRWYGWLRHLGPDGIVPALMLGYVLDGNAVDNRVRFGLEISGQVFEKPPDPDLFFGAVSLREKTKLFSEIVVPVSPEDLIPESAIDWHIGQIAMQQSRPPIWVRLVEEESGSFISFLESKGIEYRFHDRSKYTLEILSPFNIMESADFRKGLVEIQDISSQAVGLVCQPETGSCWWDVCAGSGGKSLHLSALMQGRGMVYATEIDRIMFQEMRRRVGKSRRFNNIHTLRWDGEHSPDFGVRMDGVLVDAPCSCSGTWRRNPALRWQITRDRIAAYAGIQLDLLNSCCDSVMEGGVLVYATCSIFPEENEGVVERFLEQRPGFRPVRIENPLTQQASDFGLAIGPPESNGNGMFVAKLQRQE